MKTKSNGYHGLSGISPPDFPGALLSALTLDQITLFGANLNGCTLELTIHYSSKVNETWSEFKKSPYRFPKQSNLFNTSSNEL
jgi:uncharacterized protein YjbI with pentapeptide repeats